MAKTTIHVQTTSFNVIMHCVNLRNAYHMTKFVTRRKIAPMVVTNPYIAELTNVPVFKTMVAIINA
jgi:hypothetical protein